MRTLQECPMVIWRMGVMGCLIDISKLPQNASENKMDMLEEKKRKILVLPHCGTYCISRDDPWGGYFLHILVYNIHNISVAEGNIPIVYHCVHTSVCKALPKCYLL